MDFVWFPLILKLLIVVWKLYKKKYLELFNSQIRIKDILGHLFIHKKEDVNLFNIDIKKYTIKFFVANTN